MRNAELGADTPPPRLRRTGGGIQSHAMGMGSIRLRRVVCGVSPQTSFHHLPNQTAGPYGRHEAAGGTPSAARPSSVTGLRRVDETRALPDSRGTPPLSSVIWFDLVGFTFRWVGLGANSGVCEL